MCFLLYLVFDLKSTPISLEISVPISSIREFSGKLIYQPVYILKGPIML